MLSTENKLQDSNGHSNLWNFNTTSNIAAVSTSCAQVARITLDVCLAVALYKLFCWSTTPGKEKLFHRYCSVIEGCSSTQERHLNVLTTLSCTGSSIILDLISCMQFFFDMHSSTMDLFHVYLAAATRVNTVWVIIELRLYESAP